ncbi:MAG: hypothetical protein HY912_01900 [Desulfomonile tiedjei]|uniref:Uncharacterized protein n=1 Tax=Desulfomonile tiedjei TaxID=2358 RepID=A0A9D6V004_9BACT|nr:hypothetical protein [Desulfomonile tiedjei]
MCYTISQLPALNGDDHARDPGKNMELTSALKRINQAVHAIELRQKAAVTCLRSSEESCELYFRGSIFTVSGSVCDDIPGGVEDVASIKDGFVALAKDPDNLESFLWAEAQKVIPQHEDWQNWVQGVDASHLSYYDAMQAVALYALSTVNVG